VWSLCVCVDVYTCVLWECAHVHIKKETRRECQAFLLRPARIFFLIRWEMARGDEKGTDKTDGQWGYKWHKRAAAAHRVICTHVHIQQPFWSKIIILAIHCGPENKKERVDWLGCADGIRRLGKLESTSQRDCQTWSSPTIPAMPAWIFFLLVRCCLGAVSYAIAAHLPGSPLYIYKTLGILSNIQHVLCFISMPSLDICLINVQSPAAPVI
jgi:hypothetical protein